MDRRRAEVYAAEATAFEGTDLETVRAVDDLRAAIDRVVAGEWWPGPPVRVAVMRADARSSCARRQADHVELRIAAPQATWATACHELGHALAGVDHGHDDRYRRAVLDVVVEFTNTVAGPRRGGLHAEQLRRAYDAVGLGVGARGWPAPNAADPFAL